MVGASTLAKVLHSLECSKILIAGRDIPTIQSLKSEPSVGEPFEFYEIPSVDFLSTS